MKISEMTNDQAADAMIKLAQPISNLLEDEATVNLLKELQEKHEGGGFAFIGKAIPKIVPFCMKDHRADIYAIVAALTLQPVSAIGKMKFVDTVRGLQDSIDEDFLSFFRFSGNATSRPGKE